MLKKLEIIDEAPLDSSVLDSLDEFQKELASFSSTNDWLQERKYIIKEAYDRRLITHVGLMGLKLSIPFEKDPLFLQFLARDCERQIVNNICDIITPLCFKMFFDFDLLRLNKITDDQLEQIELILQEAAKKFFPEAKDVDFSLITCMVEPTKLIVQYEDEKGVLVQTTLHKHGFHFNFTELKLNVVQGLYIAHFALALVKLRLPVPKFPENTWDEGMDMGVLKPKGGGLRKYGNNKVMDCPKCGKMRKAERKKLKAAQNAESTAGDQPLKIKRKKCDFCHSTSGRIDGGRPYKAKRVRNSDGSVDQERTKILLNDPKFCFAWTNIRCSDSKDVVTPGFTRPENCPVVPKAQYYMEQLCLEEKNIEEPEKKVVEVKTLDSKLEEKKRGRKKKDDELLRKTYRFSEHYDTIQKKYKERLYVPFGSFLIDSVQQCIRAMHPMYKDIEIVHIFHNRRRTYFVILVDGIGSSYCLNKGANHSTSNIYFYINKYHQMAQMCWSSKPVVRKTCECSAFASDAIALPEFVREQLKWKDGVSGIGSGTLQDKVECDLYKKKYLAIFRENEQKFFDMMEKESKKFEKKKSSNDLRLDAIQQHYHHVKSSSELKELCEILFNHNRVLYKAGLVDESILPPKGDPERLMFESDPDNTKLNFLMATDAQLQKRTKHKPLKDKKEKKEKKDKRKKVNSNKSDSDSQSDNEPASKRRKV